jgi:hypothetical protein
MAYTAQFETTELREFSSVQRTHTAQLETSAPADSARGDRVHARSATAHCSTLQWPDRPTPRRAGRARSALVVIAGVSPFPAPDE